MKYKVGDRVIIKGSTAYVLTANQFIGTEVIIREVISFGFNV